MAKAHAKTTAGAGGAGTHGGKKTLTGRQKAAIFLFSLHNLFFGVLQ